MLLTPFQPFPHQKINSPLHPLTHFQTKIPSHKIHPFILPTLFHHSPHIIPKLLKSKNYHLPLPIPQPRPPTQITPHPLPINIHH
ncbi:pyroglutamyl-peptidase I family protein, partial [Staphylococcus epidermidis]